MNSSTALIRSSNPHTEQHQTTTHFPKAGICNSEAHVYRLRQRGYEYAIEVPTRFHTQCYTTGGHLELQNTLTIRRSDGEAVITIASMNAGFRMTDCRSGSKYILSRNGSILFLYETFDCGRKMAIAVVRPASRGIFRRGDRVIRVVDTETDISSFTRKRFSVWNLMGRGRAFHVKSKPGYDVLMSVAVTLCCDSLDR